MAEMMTPADVRAVTCNDNGFGGNGFWIFALLILAMMGGTGFGFGRGGEQYATSADVQRGFDTSEITRKLDELKSGLSAGICDSSYALNTAILTEGRNTQAAVGEVGRQLAECCCGINRNIDAVNYNLATAIHSEGEATRAMIQENKIEALQQKIASLELAQATANTVKYPTAMTYAYNANPFCGCGNGYYA